MHPEDMVPPEALSYLGTLGISIVLVVCFLALSVIIGLYFKKNREDFKRAQGCMKTEIPEDGEHQVCLTDEYAASMVRPYLPDQEEECPECPPCACAVHGTKPEEMIKRLRELVDEFTLDSSLHEGSRFEYGQAAAYGNAATRLTEVLDELEGKDQP